MSYDPRAVAQARADRELGGLPLGAALSAIEPPARATPTSRAAADAVRESSKTQQLRVYHFAIERGPYGFTQEEASDALGIPRASMCARCWQLERSRLIEKARMPTSEAYRTRPTRSGCAAVIYLGRARP